MIITKRHELVNILRNIFVIITLIDDVRMKVRESLQLTVSKPWGHVGTCEVVGDVGTCGPQCEVTKNIAIPCIKTFVASVEAFHHPSQGLLIVTEYFKCFLDSSKRPRLSQN